MELSINFNSGESLKLLLRFDSNSFFFSFHIPHSFYLLHVALYVYTVKNVQQLFIKSHGSFVPRLDRRRLQLSIR